MKVNKVQPVLVKTVCVEGHDGTIVPPGMFRTKVCVDCECGVRFSTEPCLSGEANTYESPRWEAHVRAELAKRSGRIGLDEQGRPLCGYYGALGLGPCLCGNSFNHSRGGKFYAYFQGGHPPPPLHQTGIYRSD